MYKDQYYTGKFEKIFSYQSLMMSWLEFRNGKKKKTDVVEFALNLSRNIFDLEEEIIKGIYQHGGYKYFKISDPKPRDIHKAMVRDRIVHHAIYRAMYSYFDRFFIFDSYSCRLDKGTHRALARFKTFARKESLNNTKTVWVLKGDIRKCFASIDHQILKKIIFRHIKCLKIIQIIDVIIDSFSKGIPLGNLTSQLFVNIYLNEFDQHIKRALKIEKYIRYADDFVIFSRDKKRLEDLIPEIKLFLSKNLKLVLHPDKLFIKTVNSGIDFLGWVHFEKYKILRTSTKNRMYRRIFPDTKTDVICSYFGLLNYGNTYKIKQDVLYLLKDKYKLNNIIMEQIDIIEAKNDQNDDELAEKIEHAEAVAFVEKHRDFLEHYAKGKVKIASAPKGLKTFAFDLESDTIYINSMFYKKQGFSDEKTLFAICHVIEHFLEKLAMLSEEGGEKKFERYLKRIKTSRAFSLTDNCNADIRENKSVVSRTNKGMGELEVLIYKEDLFAETDFTSQPRHIQFSQALLRESRVSGERCNVSLDVRQALDEVANVKGLMEVMTNPETPMSMRLRLQDKYIWPKIEALLEKDMEDRKKKEQEKKDDEKVDKEPSEQGDEKEDKDQNGDDEKQGEKQDGKNKKGKKDSKDKKSENGKDNKWKKSDEGEKEKDEGGETDPNKLFADEYAEVEKKFPEAVPLEEIEKAFKKWKGSQKGKNNLDKSDEEYAEKIGVEKKDLQNYRKIVENLEKTVNPETDVSIIEELRNLFFRIISKRLKITQVPKYPVEEGDELVDPAQLVADVKSGNLQPKVWEDTEIKEKKGDRFGEVEITLVCDRSGSMAGQKAEEQRRSAVLVMEVLKEFAESCEAEKINVSKSLEVKSEIYSFASEIEDKTPIKKMSTELGEAERIKVLKKLYDVPGSTTDFNCLEAIDENLDDKTKIKIKIGELKKIVIVFTDGGSDNSAKVQGVLKSLRDSGVVVVGIGITSEGSPVLSTYAPNAMVVEDVQKLPIVLGDLLKEHLKDI